MANPSNCDYIWNEDGIKCLIKLFPIWYLQMDFDHFQTSLSKFNCKGTKYFACQMQFNIIQTESIKVIRLWLYVLKKYLSEYKRTQELTTCILSKYSVSYVGIKVCHDPSWDVSLA